LCFLPALELRRLLRARALSPVELLSAILARVEAIDGRLHAFVTLDSERALALARRQTDEAPTGTLHGMPVSIKDLEQTADLRTTFGSKFMERNIPAIDGAVAARVRAAGGIIFGKTNTPHYGHKDMCDNLLGPPTVNPWRLDRTSGASSGGAGAAVAAGLGPLAQGSDGAGSIRIPSSLCGIFGFKPSFGRVPYWPNSDIWASRSHNGPMTRTVRDAALFMDAIAGHDPRDPTSLETIEGSWIDACDGDLRGLRVGYSSDFGYASVDPEVRAASARASHRFEELGCEVIDVVPGWEDPRRFASALWDASMAYRYGRLFRERPDWVEPSLAIMIERGLRMSAVELGEAGMARSAFYDRAQAFMAGFDLLLTPQMPCTAWRHDGYPEIGGSPAPEIFDRVPFTFPFNLTGWPAASVPCGFDSAGLPVGMQIVGGWHRDRLVLRAAAAFEAVQPWADRLPPLP